MDDTRVHDGASCELDIFSQQFNPLYIHVCLFYALNKDDSISRVQDRLQRGLDRLADEFPWVAGQVVSEGAGPHNSGTLRIRPLEGGLRVIVKDLRHDPSLSMPDMKGRDFPNSCLPEETLCPYPARGTGLQERPVFAVQANFVQQGLILTFSGQHTASDMTGLAETIRLFSKACQQPHDEASFTAEELATGNADRSRLVDFFDEKWQPDDQLTRRWTLPEASPSNGPSSATGNTEGVWANFSFSAQSLAELKDVAMHDAREGEYVSTDDAISALLWRSITRVRLALRSDKAGKEASSDSNDIENNSSPSPSTTTLARTIDLRPFLGIPATSPGNLANRAYATQHPHTLAQTQSLSKTALDLRAEISGSQRSKIAYEAKAYATLLSRSEDKSRLTRKRALDASDMDVNLSSWARFSELWRCEFGLGCGGALAVRMPGFTPNLSRGIVMLLPKDPQGGMAVVLCLSVKDMEGLRRDEEWGKFAQWIG